MARDKEKRSCGQVVAEWRAFLWDPRTRQFLGRTGSSWGLILLFYLVFYGFLAGLFALTMWVMLQSVDPHVPKYQDRLLTPGLMIRPCAEGLDVTFNVTQSHTWEQHVRALHQFLEPYNDSVQAARNAACPAGRYNEQPDDAVPNYPKRACRFERSRLGPCAGLGPHGDYGYGSGRPCVLVKVNRVSWEHWEGLGYTGRDWVILGGTGLYWEGIGMDWEGIGMDWEGIGIDWEGLGGTGRELGWTGRDWVILGRTGLYWEELGYTGSAGRAVVGVVLLGLMGLGSTGRDWDGLGGNWDGLGGNWDGLGGNWDGLGGTGMDWEGTGMDWEGLGGTGMDWEGLGWTGRDWVILGGTGRDWEGLGGTGRELGWIWRELGWTGRELGWTGRELGYTGRDWVVLGGTGRAVVGVVLLGLMGLGSTGRDWDGLGGNWDGLGGTGRELGWTGRELGWTGRELGWTGRDWYGLGVLGGTGLYWEGLGEQLWAWFCWG
uniref:Sodium/potassium-transporting ATPase subunit beta-2 n=1 Tax=Taeniopygia guttata TaxID=59729 RepID=A0A674HHU2_TAEGU